MTPIDDERGSPNPELAPRHTTHLGDLAPTRLARAPDTRANATELSDDSAAQRDLLASDAARAPLREALAGFGRYEVRRELGRGGMGAVLLAFDRAFRREVALKVMLTPDAPAATLARFVQEAQLTGQLAHPGIPPVHELGTTPDGRPYYAMKVVRGASLREWLDRARSEPRGRAFPLARRLEALIRVGEALDYAHAHGVIHRDLKPENVLVGEFGEVLVMDWGLAKVVGAPESVALGSPVVESPRDRRLATLDGEVAGTPAYMAPEQARGELSALDARTDVFALGALLYEMLALAPPYHGESVFAILEQAGEAAWTPLPERIRRDSRRVPTPPPELVAVAHRALARAPSDRYPSAAAFVGDLRAFLAHEPVSVHHDSAMGRLVKTVQRHPRLALTMASGLAIAVLTTQLAIARRTAEAEGLRAEVAEHRAKSDAATAELARRDAAAAQAEREAALALAKRVTDETEQRLADETRSVVDEFRRLATESRARGEAYSQFERSIRDARFDAFVHAFDDLFRYYELTNQSPRAIDHFHRAVLRRMAGHMGEAQADLEAAHRLEPSNAGTLNLLGATRSARGDTTGALAAFDLALEIEPRYADARANRGTARLAAGDPAGAIDDYDRAVALDPRQYEVLYNRGVAKRKMGDLEGAIADYGRALDLEPRAIDALNARAIALVARGELASALADYDRALGIAPRDPDLLRGRGHARHVAGDLDGALRDYDLAIEVRPSDAACWSNRGAAKADKRDFDGAIADYTQAIALDPRRHYAFLNRGNARQTQGDLSGAVADYDRALELDPACWRAAANRGGAYAALGRVPEALASFQLARRLCPDPAMRAKLEPSIRTLGGVPE